MDLERVDLEAEEYDVVLCVNVLEHAREPHAVLHQAWNSLKTGGMFVIVGPNVVSVKSFVVRLIPWSAQRWMYARILRADGYPARAVHSFSLRPSSLLAQARLRGWKLEYFRAYEGPVQMSVRHRFGVVGWRWRILVALTRLVTLGVLTAVTEKDWVKCESLAPANAWYLPVHAECSPGLMEAVDRILATVDTKVSCGPNSPNCKGRLDVARAVGVR